MFWLIIFAVTWACCKVFEVFEPLDTSSRYEFDFLKQLEETKDDKRKD